MMQGSLAERLRILRARKGLSLTEASERIVITRHTLRSLELGGQEPHYPTLHKIAEGYGVLVEDLLEEPTVPLGEAPLPPDVPADGSETDEERQQRLHYLRYWRVFIIGLARRLEEEPPSTLRDIMPVLGALVAVLEKGMLDPPSWHVGLSEDFDRAQVWRGIRRIVEVANSVEQGEEGGATVRYLQEKLGA
jgi:transcriptional regulator with XRE-family HTH domain